MRFSIYTIVLFFLLLLTGSCSGEDEEKSRQSNQMEMSEDGHDAHDEMAMVSGEATDESLYNVSSIWKNQYGQQVPLNSLKGKVQVVAMVYTHCEYACPRILADMKRIRDRLSESELASTNFLIVSIDPERDTPERLSRFAKENDLSEEQWTLLNGDQGDVLELAALLGVKYKRISETDFTHSNMITVLNKEGEITHQRNRLGDNPSDIVAAIKKVKQ